MPEETQQDQTAQNEAVEQPTAPASPAAEEQTPQAGADSSATPSDQGETTETTDGEQRPGRAERRIKTLATQLKEAQAQQQVEQFDQRFADPAKPASAALPWQTPDANEPTPWQRFEAGEITYEQATEQRATQLAEQIVQRELGKRDTLSAAERQQEQFLQSVTQDALALEQKYPQLNDQSEHYDKESAQEIMKLYEERVLASPRNAPSLMAFTDRIMKVQQRAQDQGRDQSVTTLAQQIADSALTPDSGRTTENTGKDFSKMTKAEREAHLGYAA